MSVPLLGPHQHSITALVQNETGTINRLVSMFRRRGISLASFNAGDCEQEGFSRITILVNGDNTVMSQTIRQMDKLVDVVECEDLGPDERVMREVVLISFDPVVVDRQKLDALADKYQAQFEHDTQTCIVLAYTGPIRLVEQYLKEIADFPILEIVRSGPCALKVR